MIGIRRCTNAWLLEIRKEEHFVSQSTQRAAGGRVWSTDVAVYNPRTLPSYALYSYALSSAAQEHAANAYSSTYAMTTVATKKPNR